MNKSKLIISTVLLVSLSITSIGCSKKSNVDNVNSKLDKIIFPKEKDGNISIDLYYVDNSNQSLKKEERYLNKDELIGETIINELLKGPAINNNLINIFPKNSKLISISIKDKIAYLNLSSEIKSISKDNERLVLTSLSKTLEQLPSVTKIQITIDNNGVDTLAGGYDISKPFSSEEIDIIKNK